MTIFFRNATRSCYTPSTPQWVACDSSWWTFLGMMPIYGSLLCSTRFIVFCCFLLFNLIASEHINPEGIITQPAFASWFDWALFLRGKKKVDKERWEKKNWKQKLHARKKNENKFLKKQQPSCFATIFDWQQTLSRDWIARNNLSSMDCSGKWALQKNATKNI